MIKAKSSVKLYQPKIRQLTDNAVRALELTAEKLHEEVQQAQVVPFDTGNLQGESFFVDTSQSREGKVTLVHSTPYARRLYFHPEYDFQKDENPNAKGLWFEDWLEGGEHEDFVRETFAKIFRRLSRS